MIYFIVNPAAGRGKTLAAVPIITETMTRERRPYKIIHTASPSDAASIAREAVKRGAEAVVAIGGDGTVQESAEGLINTNVPLGILPSGSGNDFIHTLIKKSADKPPPKGFAECTRFYLNRILNTEPSYIDAVKIQDMFFLNIGSIGIDAEIVIDADGMKKRLGKAAYLAATFKNSMTYRPSAVRIVCDGAEYSGEPTLAALCNGQYYGGGFKIAPPAEINDGYITACIIEKMPKFKVLALFPTVLFGRHAALNEVKFINCKKVGIFYDGIRNINLDGNIYKLKGPLEIEIVEKGLKIFY